MHEVQGKLYIVSKKIVYICLYLEETYLTN